MRCSVRIVGLRSIRQRLGGPESRKKGESVSDVWRVVIEQAGTQEVLVRAETMGEAKKIAETMELPDSEWEQRAPMVVWAEKVDEPTGQVWDGTAWEV